MWTCSSCCQENEDHAIFCRQCGGMRGDVRPPAPDGVIPRSPLEPKPSGESVVPEWRPDPPGCGFLTGWTAATAGAEFLAGIAISFLYQVYYLSTRHHTALDPADRFILGTLSGIAGGAALGGAQTLMLSMAAPGRRWSAWWIATLAAFTLGSIGVTATYLVLGAGKETTLAAWAAGGAVFGLLTGAVQALVLRRMTPASGLILWILATLSSHVVISVVSYGLYDLTRERGLAWLNLMTYGGALVRGMILGLLTGLVMTILLRRAACAAPLPPAQ